jgi:Alginate export
MRLTCQNTGFFLKQAFREVKLSSSSLGRIGRFEFGDGRDVVPKDAALAWTKDQRLADRLLGVLGGTPVGRSYDGASYTQTRGAHTLTALVASPTRGVFDLDGQETLSHVKAAYAGQTQATPTSESRLFSMWYQDTRGNTKKTDKATMVDFAPIRLLTLGGSVIGVKQTPSGPLDGALWGAFQGGDWGGQTVRAASALGEVGWRPNQAKGRLWLRAGMLWCSGDRDPSDTSHGTFYPLLVAPKLYARPPFYAFANVDDKFLTVRYLPKKDLSTRLEWHSVSLADGRDLWYQVERRLWGSWWIWLWTGPLRQPVRSRSIWVTHWEKKSCERPSPQAMPGLVFWK